MTYSNYIARQAHYLDKLKSPEANNQSWVPFGPPDSINSWTPYMNKMVEIK